jgi:DNA replication initiation complex subunit (GINS family)
MIYSDVEKAYRLERANPTLQKIQDNFYDDANRLAQHPDAGEYKLTILDYIDKIYSLRSNKLIHYAGRAAPGSKPPDNMLPAEQKLYKRIIEAISESKAEVMERKPEPQPVIEQPTVKVRMKQPLPAIAGTDGREYGPYKVDDVAELPLDSANILLGRNAAEKL